MPRGLEGHREIGGARTIAFNDRGMRANHLSLSQVHGARHGLMGPRLRTDMGAPGSAPTTTSSTTTPTASSTTTPPTTSSTPSTSSPTSASTTDPSTTTTATTTTAPAPTPTATQSPNIPVSATSPTNPGSGSSTSVSPANAPFSPFGGFGDARFGGTATVWGGAPGAAGQVTGGGAWDGRGGGPFGGWTSSSSNTSGSSGTTGAQGTDTQLKTDFQKLQSDLQAIDAKSQVTVAETTALRVDYQKIQSEATSKPDSSKLTTLTNDIKALNGQLPSTTQTQQLTADFTAVLNSEGITDSSLISQTVSDIQAIEKSSNVTADDLTTIAADRNTIQTDTSSDKNGGSSTTTTSNTLPNPTDPLGWPALGGIPGGPLGGPQHG